MKNVNELVLGNVRDMNIEVQDLNINALEKVESALYQLQKMEVSSRVFDTLLDVRDALEISTDILDEALDASSSNTYVEMEEFISNSFDEDSTLIELSVGLMKGRV